MSDLLQPTTAVELTNLVKTYGKTQALKGIDMRVAAGTVHALVGENGAGKSTALGVMSGRVTPSEGEVKIFGEKMRCGDPRVSRRAGVVAIHQELTIVQALTVEANVFLAGPLSRGGFLSEREMRRRYLGLCARAGVGAHPPGTLAGSLSVAEQQVVEILRALVSDARVILFDEPTASLAVAERVALFRMIRTLRDEGVTIVLVSHNLDEVLDISDEITVFRDGRLTVTEDRSHFTKSVLVEAMIGREGDRRVLEGLLEDDPARPVEATPRKGRTTVRKGPPALLATGITVPGALEDGSIEVHAGERIGIGGLVGSGRSTMLRALAGLEPTSSGQMWIDGIEVRWPHSVRRALAYGIALVPEDRKTQGLVMAMTVMDNIALSDFRSTSKGPFLSNKTVERATQGVGSAFGLSPTRLKDRAWHLSGGNQQKILLARWKHRTPRILLADEPTRGIDVGAKAEILSSLEQMAIDGVGIVVVSSELEEVVTIAERVIVLSEGHQVGELTAGGTRISPADILNLAFRVNDAASDRAPSNADTKELHHYA